MSTKATRDAYGEWLLEKGRDHPEIVVVDADLSESTKTIVFGKAYPNRVFNVGAAEQNLVNVAAGLALGGKRVFASSFAYFLTARAWDQIRNIVAHDELNVAFVATHAGLSASADGSSHQALEDIALIRVIPNMIIFSPCDAEETKWALDNLLASRGPFYMRLRREKEPILQKDYIFKRGRAETMLDGSDLTLISTGALVDNCLKAAEILKRKNIHTKVINIHTIKPLDELAIERAARDTGLIVTVEDHQVKGGLGGAVSEVTSASYPVPVHRIGVPDVFGGSARATEELYREFGLTFPQIAERAERVIQKQRN